MIESTHHVIRRETDEAEAAKMSDHELLHEAAALQDELDALDDWARASNFEDYTRRRLMAINGEYNRRLNHA